MILIGLKIYEIVQNLLLNFVKALNFFKKSEKLSLFITLRSSKAFLENVQKTSEAFRAVQAQNHSARIFWFHVASAGELEQIVPLAHTLHAKLNAYFFVTYYSPSTIPFLKNVPWCLGTSGLPLDGFQIYAKAYKIIAFQKIFFVRYDFWPGLIYFATQKNIELNLLCATQSRTKSGFLGIVSKHWNLFLYKKFKNIFVAFEQDVQFFKTHLPNQTIVFSGDTKWHRAWQRAHAFHERLSNRATSQDQFLKFFLLVDNAIKARNLKCIVFGSPHDQEHELALNYLAYLKSDILMIYVPHKISQASCQALLQEVKTHGGTPCLYSDFSKDHFKFSSQNVVVVDAMGHLAEIYALAHIAVIGGGFDGQIHNVLEAAAHGVSIAIGEKFSRAPEAKMLVDSKVAFAFPTSNLLFQFLVQWGTLGMHMKELQNARIVAKSLFESMPDTNEIITNTLIQEIQYDKQTIDH